MADVADRVRRAPLVALLALTGALAVTPAAQAEADSCDGVWVAVDASELDAGATTRCAPGDPSSGLDALTKAGHTYAFVPGNQGMVCTIDRRPDPCNNAPTDAYWSYWHASAGGEWRYSSTGAGKRDPEPGTVEGWAFGAGEPPSQRPPANPPADETPEADTDGGSEDGGDEGPSGDGEDDPSGRSDTGGSSGSDSPSGGAADSSSPTTPSSGASPSPDSSGDGAPSSTGGEGGADAPGAGTDADVATATDDTEDDQSADDAGDGRDDSDDTGDAQPDESDVDQPSSPAAESTVGDDDVIALEGANPSGGRRAGGLLAGGTLVAAIAGAAALRARRRTGLHG